MRAELLPEVMGNIACITLPRLNCEQIETVSD